MTFFKVVTAPSEEPLTVDEVKYHCRIDEYNQDAVNEHALLNVLISTARQQAESYLKRYLITQTIDCYMDEFPYWEIRLPPIQSVSSITYLDQDGVSAVLSPSNYIVDSVSMPSRITPSYGNVWPVAREQNNAVIVRFVAGYGAKAAVPQCIKNWMLMRIKTLYDSRDELMTSNGDIVLQQGYVDGLLDSERVRAYL